MIWIKRLKSAWKEGMDSSLKSKIIQKLIHKVEVGVDEVAIKFYVGEKYFKRESALADSLLLSPEKNF